jgi:hypothetical protein
MVHQLLDAGLWIDSVPIISQNFGESYKNVLVATSLTVDRHQCLKAMLYIELL